MMLRRSRTLSIVTLLVAVVGIASLAMSSGLGPVSIAAAIPADDDASQLDPREALRFEQEKALAHMRELEERIYRLSQLLQDVEPDHAARLVLGLRKAREDLIVDEMAEVRRLIDAGKLDEASRRQRQVLVRLDELRDLLLSTDLDLILKLERLRKLNQAIEKLDKIIAEEEREKQRSEKLAAEQGPPAEAGGAGEGDSEPVEGESGTPSSAASELTPEQREKLERLRRDQEQNRRATDSLREEVRSIASSGMKAPGKLGEASGSMAGAESSLEQGAPAGAKDRQEEAIEELEEALADLERERRELQDELQEQIRAQIMDALAQMLEKQEKIRGETEVQARATTASEARTETLRGLSDAETSLVDSIDKTVRLIEETEFSLVLPMALAAVRVEMEAVARQLGELRADDEVIAAEKRIEADLRELLQTLEEEQRGAQKASEGGGCEGCKEKNKLVAELKVIRMIQMKIRRGTHDADGQQSRPIPPAVAELIRQLRDKEAKIRDMTQKLHEQGCPDCERGVH